MLNSAIIDSNIDPDLNRQAKAIESFTLSRGARTMCPGPGYAYALSTGWGDPTVSNDSKSATASDVCA